MPPHRAKGLDKKPLGLRLPKFMGNLNLKNPIIRQVAVRKLRTVYQRRHHRFLGQKYAFLHKSLLYNLWLSCLAIALCFLSGVWVQIMVVCGVSPVSIIAAISFPLDFLVLFIGLLGIWDCNYLRL
jgi:hypothetical protein